MVTKLFRVLGFVALAALPGRAAAQNPDFGAIWGSGAGDAWILGRGTTALHWDGTAWSPMPLPAGEWSEFMISTMWGGGPNDVWAVGGCRVLHWNGTEWALNTPCRTGVSSGEIVAVAGFGPDDVYLVEQSQALDDTPDLHHWDGREWTRMVIPLPFRVGGLAAYGAELLVVGAIQFDPPTGPPLAMGVVGRLRGDDWQFSVGGHGQRGGTTWTALTTSGRNALAVGSRRSASGTVSEAPYVSRVGLSTYVEPRVRRPAARGAAAAPADAEGTGFEAWEEEAGPSESSDSVNIVRASLAGDVVLAAVRGGFARRVAGRWIVVPTRAPGLTAEMFSNATAVWGAAAADFWIVSEGAVVRVESGVARLAFEAGCLGMGARAAASPNCRLFSGRAAARPAPAVVPVAPSPRKP